jgi:hypothetical protein
MGFAIAKQDAFGTRNEGLWDPPEVPFEISQSDFPLGSDALGEIELAIEKWNTQAPHIRLIDRKPQHDNFVVFVATDEGQCRSPVGRQRGRQEIKCDFRGDFGNDPAAGFGNVMHEIGHAIGLDHEHQRPDRGDFIKLIEQNIVDMSQFEIIDDGSLLPIGIYDYDSIMHYAPGNPPRFEVLQLDTQPGALVGQRFRLSLRDVGTTLFLYGFQLTQSVDFGETAIGEIKTRLIKLVNRAPTALNVTTGGVSPAFFNLAKGFPTQVGASSSAEAIVEFFPQGAGHVKATLFVTIADVLLSIRLLGRAKEGIHPD